jgi:hypothetical protein
VSLRRRLLSNSEFVLLIIFTIDTDITFALANVDSIHSTSITLTVPGDYAAVPLVPDGPP